MANEVQTKVKESQQKNEKSGFLDKIKGLFQKKQGGSKEGGNSRLTKAFHVTRNDSIVSVVIAILVVLGAIYFGKVVIDDYAELNSQADELKNLSEYKVVLNTGRLEPYEFDNNLSTINGLINVDSSIKDELVRNEILKQQQKGYYEVLLQNIYLPSLNIWKDPYTKNFDMSVLGQKYLERDKFQDLYLIQHWSDFVKYVGNDADYNVIDNIVIGDKVILENNPEYFYIPITISFSSPNKRSFLLLVNKLSMTSNQNNISLLNEFFAHLLNSIRAGKSEEVNELMQKYWEDFSSSSSWDFDKDFSNLSSGDVAIYRDRVIGYNLYHRINGDGDDDIQLIDDEIIMNAIKESALCPNSLDQKCFYDFRDKYRNLPYLAYKIGLENQNNRTEGLLEFLQDLPSAIAITNFGFEKYSDSSFLNNKEEEYEGKVSFNAYGRNVTDEEIKEASSMLGKLCFGNSSEQSITPDLALTRVNQTITLMGLDRMNEEKSGGEGGEREYSSVSSLGELQGLFTEIQESYNGMSNYDKLIKLFEIRRMMNDANLCNK